MLPHSPKKETQYQQLPRSESWVMLIVDNSFRQFDKIKELNLVRGS